MPSTVPTSQAMCCRLFVALQKGFEGSSSVLRNVLSSPQAAVQQMTLPDVPRVMLLAYARVLGFAVLAAVLGCCMHCMRVRRRAQGEARVHAQYRMTVTKRQETVLEGPAENDAQVGLLWGTVGCVSGATTGMHCLLCSHLL